MDPQKHRSALINLPNTNIWPVYPLPGYFSIAPPPPPPPATARHWKSDKYRCLPTRADLFIYFRPPNKTAIAAALTSIVRGNINPFHYKTLPRYYAGKLESAICLLRQARRRGERKAPINKSEQQRRGDPAVGPRRPHGDTVRGINSHRLWSRPRTISEFPTGLHSSPHNTNSTLKIPAPAGRHHHRLPSQSTVNLFNVYLPLWKCAFHSRPRLSPWRRRKLQHPGPDMQTIPPTLQSSVRRTEALAVKAYVHSDLLIPSFSVPRQ
ncbi:hypothetical protein J6590_014587 [Homalodisca vitripennis]|nr:hypothetical protein J6590_014587 [Homalodisca vitripennis]